MDSSQLFLRFKTLEDTSKLLKTPNGEFICPTDTNILDNELLLIKRIGSSSINGEVIQTCYPLACGRDNKKHMILATKKIPLKPEDIPLINKHTKKEAMTTETWVEIMCMKLGTYIVKDRICPNLPLYLKYFMCDNCQFSSKEVIDKFRQPNGDVGRVPCLLLINEYATGGDLKMWLKEPRTTIEWATMFFQVFAGLYCMQKYFDITHHDLHWGNVLVHKINTADDGEFIRYKIDGKKYYIPNTGYLFTLWDFGYARSPGKLEITKLQDYYKDPTQNPRYIVDYFRISNCVYWAKQEYNVDIPTEVSDTFLKEILFHYQQGNTLSTVFPILFKSFLTSSRSSILKYSLDKKLTSIPEKYMYLLNENTDFTKQQHVTTVDTLIPHLKKHGQKSMSVDPVSKKLQVQTGMVYDYMDIDSIL